MPGEGQFVEAAGRAGIGDGVFVVAYGSMGGAERLWWLLRHFGHGDCAVVDLTGWLGPLRGGEEEIAPGEFNPRPLTGDTIAAAELQEHLSELVQPAVHVAEIRRRPWWR